MVTDIIKGNVIYDDDWRGVELPDLDVALEQYNNNRNRFLYYPWGVYVTAYARRNLYSGILEFGEDYIYSDTDSIKCLNIDKHMSYINRYNEWITKRIYAVLDHYGIDRRRSAPLNKRGELKPIGVWDWETQGQPYTDFKTLGAKRYIYKQAGDLHITIAGVSKKMGKDYLRSQDDPFMYFGDDMVIDASHSGKLTHTYLDDEQSGTAYDYKGNKFSYYEKSSVHLEPSEYKMSLLEDFKDFCQKKKRGTDIFYG